MHLDLRLISHALVLAKHRNFQRAARALHISQPTLSRSIAALETSLGVRLFDRDPSGIEPTAFGRLVLERGRELLAEESDLRREISMQAGLETGSIAVSAGPYPFEVSVVDALTRLIEEHPRLTVQATVAHARDVVRDVLNGHVDVGITDRALAVNHERLNFEPLPTHRIYLACRPGHPLANRRRVTPAEIAAYPLAATDVIGHVAELMTSLGAKSGQFDADSGDYRPAIHVNSLSAARRFASGSDALAPGIAVMLATDIEAGRLVKLNFQLAKLVTRYGIMTLKGRTLSPVATKFIALLRTAEAAVVQAEAQLRAVAPKPGKAVPRGRRPRR